MRKLDLVILAGGVGSRIKRHLSGRPKPMLEFNNKNFLNYVINNFSKYNFNKIFIITRYKSHIIHKKFHNKEFNFTNIEKAVTLFNINRKLSHIDKVFLYKVDVEKTIIKPTLTDLSRIFGSH